MNDYDLLYKKIEAQDKIINEQVLEIARLKEQRYNLKEDFKRHIDRINELTERIDKARKMIFDNYGVLDKYEIELLDDVLKGDKE